MAPKGPSKGKKFNPIDLTGSDDDYDNNASNNKLTWGVELEFVYAFHESTVKLKPIYKDGEYHKTSLKKDTSYSERAAVTTSRALNTQRNSAGNVKYPLLPRDRTYNSWLIQNEYNKELEVYGEEVKQILSQVLTKKCPRIKNRVQDKMEAEEKVEMYYNEWLVMSEISICGVGSANIPAWIPEVTSKTDWDSFGLELASPIFESDSDQGYTEISKILEATRGIAKTRFPGGKAVNVSGGRTAAFITNQCGLHVHVQAPEDIKVLQKLAWVIFVYEAQIARLHPPCRRPMHPNAAYVVESNRIRLLHQPDCTPNRYTYTKFDVSDDELIRTSYGIMRDTIHNREDAASLATLMNAPVARKDQNFMDVGNRNRQVNFTTAARDKYFPCTIALRQARGSLNPIIIRKWVEFCIGLIRVAQFYAENPNKFPVQEFDKNARNADNKLLKTRISIMDMMQDMGLSEEDQDFWKDRMARFSVTGGPLDRKDDEKPDGLGILGSGGDNADDYSGPRGRGGGGGGGGGSGPGGNKRKNDGGENPSAKKRPKNSGTAQPEKGSTAKKGDMAIDATMFYDGRSWLVRDFNREHWIAEPTECSFQQKDGFCGLWALIGSMRNQYPDSEYVKGIRNDQLIKDLSEIQLEVRKEVQQQFKRPVGPDDAAHDQVDEVLKRWTNNNFALVVCDNSDDSNHKCYPSSLTFNEDTKSKKSKTASRVGSLKRQASAGYNLYLSYDHVWHAKRLEMESGVYKETDMKVYVGVHWESMKKVVEEMRVL